jgi:hypothetical protein
MRKNPHLSKINFLDFDFLVDVLISGYVAIQIVLIVEHQSIDHHPLDIDNEHVQDEIIIPFNKFLSNHRLLNNNLKRIFSLFFYSIYLLK